VRDEEVEAIRIRLRAAIPRSRYEHSRRVEEESRRLAVKFGADPDVCALAGLLHDCARDLPADELAAIWSRLDPGQTAEPVVLNSALLHGPVGAVIACEAYGVCDPRVLRAIQRHTLGAPDMAVEDKVVCLADYVESGRRFPGVESIRSLARCDLDSALICALDGTIKHLVDAGALIDVNVILTRNALLRKYNRMPKAGDIPANQHRETAE
jgi:predicted HD superfamily hydrolase involved in NAD metabolism